MFERMIRNNNIIATRRRRFNKERQSSLLLLLLTLLLLDSSSRLLYTARAASAARRSPFHLPRVAVRNTDTLHVQQLQRLPFLLRIRGGGAGSGDDGDSSWQRNDLPSQQSGPQPTQSSPLPPLDPNQQQQQKQQYSSDSSSPPISDQNSYSQPPAAYTPPSSSSSSAASLVANSEKYNENGDPFHESVQDRVDEWKMRQRELGQETMDSARDEMGRVKLLTSVSKGSRVLIFFCLMWRDIHLFEVADQRFRLGSRAGSASGGGGGILRLLTVVPLVFLFLANMAGAVLSLMTMSPSHAAKKRLKAILNLDKMLEAAIMLYCLLRLTIFPNRYTPRELYVASTFHSVFFIAQCQTFTRLSWDEHSARPASSYAASAAPTATSQQQQQEQLGDEDDASQRLQYQPQQQQPQQEPDAYYSPLQDRDVWYDDGEGDGYQ